MELKEIGKIIAAWALHVPEIATVYLYGSRVKGTHREDSDLDIAIEFDQRIIAAAENAEGMTTWFLKRREWQKQLQNRLPMEVQLEWLHPEKTKIVATGIAEASRVVYKKQRGRCLPAPPDLPEN